MSKFLAGWKTRIFSGLVFLYGLVELLDPNVITSAFGLGTRGHAVSILAIAVMTYILRQITTGPAGNQK